MPKSSIAMRTPSCLTACQPAHRLLGVAHDRGLGDLQRQRARVEATLAQRRRGRAPTNSSVSSWRAETFTDIPIAWPASRQPGALAAGLAQHPAADLGDHPGLLQQRHEVVGLHHPASRAVPAQQRLHARGAHVLEVEGRLVDEEELLASAALRAGPSPAPCGSARRPASWTRTPRSGSCRPTWRGTSRRRRRAAAPRRSRAAPIAIPTLAVTARRAAWASSSRRNGGASASSRRSAISSGPAARDIPSAITTNSSPPRRPSASVSRIASRRRAATAFSSRSPAPWPSVSLMPLKLSRSMNSAATGVWLAARAHQHLLDAVEDQGAVGQARERVVGGEEHQLVLAAGELLVGAAALLLEGLAHPHQRHVEAALQHAQAPARAPPRRAPAPARARAPPPRRRRASAGSAW